MRAERRLNTTKSNSQSDKNLLRLLSGCYQGYSSEAFRGLPGKVLGMKLTRRCNGDRKVKKSDTYLLHFERLRWELLKVNVKDLDIYNLLGKIARKSNATARRAFSGNKTLPGIPFNLSEVVPSVRA